MAWTKAKTSIVTGVVVLLLSGTTAVLVTHASKPLSSAGHEVDLPVDQTTPKGALLFMARAMEAGDAQKYVQGFAFVTPEELQLKATLEELVSGDAKFKNALIATFGAEQANQAFPNLPFVIPTQFIATATEKIQGDSATVTFAGGKGGRPIRFTKRNNEWKMASDGFWHLDPLVMHDLLGRAIHALNETIGEIPSGKYTNAMEAVDAMKEKAR